MLKEKNGHRHMDDSKECIPHAPKVAIVYFSYSCQTAKLVKAIKEGLEENGVEVISQRIYPKEKLFFPFKNSIETLYMMFKTFFRVRMEIEDMDLDFLHDTDVVILGGPTWSYNPSGPILFFLDKYGHLLAEKQVIPLISCRKYWKHHYRYLRKRLATLGAIVNDPWVFDHKVKDEPWSAIGTFLTLAGKNPKHSPFMRRHYPKYGHSKEAFERAHQLAAILAKKLTNKK